MNIEITAKYQDMINEIAKAIGVKPEAALKEIVLSSIIEEYSQLNVAKCHVCHASIDNGDICQDCYDAIVLATPCRDCGAIIPEDEARAAFHKAGRTNFLPLCANCRPVPMRQAGLPQIIAPVEAPAQPAQEDFSTRNIRVATT